MINAADNGRVRPVDSEQQKVISDLEPDIGEWQGRLDTAKLQMYLGAKEARENLRPHVEKLEHDLGRVNESWTQLKGSSENTWKDTHHGLKISLLALRRSFDKAKQYFDDPDDI